MLNTESEGTQGSGPDITHNLAALPQAGFNIFGPVKWGAWLGLAQRLNSLWVFANHLAIASDLLTENHLCCKGLIL